MHSVQTSMFRKSRPVKTKAKQDSRFKNLLPFQHSFSTTQLIGICFGSLRERQQNKWNREQNQNRANSLQECGIIQDVAYSLLTANV